jgi:hypothetical protein
VTPELDLDVMIVHGEVDAHPETVSRAKLLLLTREADAAFRSNVNYAIDMARAANAAARKAQERQED